MGLQQDRGASLVDVLDRVLDKGVVIDLWVRVSVVGLDLVTAEARIVVASIETYLQHSEALGASLRASPPAIVGRGRHAASLMPASNAWK